MSVQGDDGTEPSLWLISRPSPACALWASLQPGLCPSSSLPHAVPSPRVLCPLPSPRQDLRQTGSTQKEGKGAQPCPAHPGKPLLWAVGCGWQASRAAFLVSLGGNSRSAPGRGGCWCGRQTCEGGGSAPLFAHPAARLSSPPGQATLPPPAGDFRLPPRLPSRPALLR